jgi:hypothetical protein
MVESIVSGSKKESAAPIKSATVGSRVVVVVVVTIVSSRKEGRKEGREG